MTNVLATAFQHHASACPREGKGCPSVEAIAAAMHGSGDTDTLAALSTCTRCAAIGQIERGLQTQGSTHAKMDGRRRFPRYWAVAAGVLLALGAGTAMTLLRPPGADEVLRGGAGALYPDIGSELAGSPSEFRWTIAAGAICRVDVRRPTGERVWRSDGVRGGRATVDSPLPSGDYLWTVSCAADELGPFHFRVK